jgi:hypothetical protein
MKSKNEYFKTIAELVFQKRAESLASRRAFDRTPARMLEESGAVERGLSQVTPEQSRQAAEDLRVRVGAKQTRQEDEAEKEGVRSEFDESMKNLGLNDEQVGLARSKPSEFAGEIDWKGRNTDPQLIIEALKSAGKAKEANIAKAMTLALANYPDEFESVFTVPPPRKNPPALPIKKVAKVQEKERADMRELKYPSMVKGTGKKEKSTYEFDTQTGEPLNMRETQYSKELSPAEMIAFMNADRKTRRMLMGGSK